MAIKAKPEQPTRRAVQPVPVAETEPVQAYAPPVSAADIEADWDDEHLLDVVTLPSGKRVQVRAVSMLSMIGQKTLPNSLLAAAKRNIGIRDTQTEQAALSDDETAIAGVQLIDHVVCQMCVHPQFVTRPRGECQPGERSVFEMSDPDKNYLFTLAMRGQQALRDFRPEPTSGRPADDRADVAAGEAAE